MTVKPGPLPNPDPDPLPPDPRPFPSPEPPLPDPEPNPSPPVRPPIPRITLMHGLHGGRQRIWQGTNIFFRERSAS
jgi:hypothetical protein